MSILPVQPVFRQAVPDRILKNLNIKIRKNGSIALLALFQKLTDPRGWGRLDNGTPKWGNKAERLIAGRYPNSVSNARLQNHYSKIEPLYFSADSYLKDYKYTLAGIDIDAGGRHGKGTAEGALAFLKRELEPLFGINLYWERSRNGIGINAYFLIERVYHDSAFNIRTALAHLQTYLKSRVTPTDDIALVEVKGMPTNYKYELNTVTERWELRDVERGSLLRYPTTTDFRKLLSTALVSTFELIELDVTPRPQTAPTATKPATQATSVPDSTPLRAGSTASGLTYGDVKQLPRYEKKAQQLLCRFPMESNIAGGKKIARADIAVLLLILDYCARNPNKDDTQPHKRLFALWKVLYQHELDLPHSQRSSVDVRSPANERIAHIRNWLSGINALEWIDKTYSPPTKSTNGEIIKGKACKWKAKASFIAWLATAESTTTVLVTSDLKVVPCIKPECTVPVRKAVRLRFVHEDVEREMCEWRMAA